MNHICYFFRATEDPFVFPLGSPLHIAILFVAFGGGYVLLKKQSFLEKLQIRRPFELTLAWTLLIEQLCLTGWFLFSVKAGADRWLPLYTCRIAILCAVWILFFGDHDKLKCIPIYWGIFGGVLSSLYPDPEHYIFPHVSNFAYFLGHILLLWCGVYWIGQGWSFRKEHLPFMLFVTNSVLLLCLFINHLTGANYNYLREAPIFKADFASLPHGLYQFLIFAFFNLLVLLIYQFGRNIQRRA